MQVQGRQPRRRQPVAVQVGVPFRWPASAQGRPVVADCGVPVRRRADRVQHQGDVLGGVVSGRPPPPQPRHHPRRGTFWQPGQLEVPEVPEAQQLAGQPGDQTAHVRDLATERRGGRHRHEYGLVERAVRHRGQAGARHRAPVVPDQDVATRWARRIEDAQCVVHQRPDLVAAIGRQRGRRVSTHERRDHPPARFGQHGGHLAPAVCGIGKPVQAQRDRTVLRPPRQRPQRDVGRDDVEAPRLDQGHRPIRAGTRRSATCRPACRASPAHSKPCWWARRYRRRRSG